MQQPTTPPEPPMHPEVWPLFLAGSKKIAPEVDKVRMARDDLNQENIESALALYEKALAKAREVGDALGENDTLGCIGQAQKYLKRNEEARLNLIAAVAYRRNLKAAGRTFRYALFLSNLGYACADLKRRREAHAAFRESADVYKDCGVAVYQGLALATAGQNNPTAKEGLAELREAETILSRLKDNNQWVTRQRIAWRQAEMGDLPGALRTQQETIYRTPDEGMRQSETINLATTYKLMGDGKTAISLTTKEAAIGRKALARKPDDKGTMATLALILANLGGYLMEDGAFDAADDALAESARLIRSAGRDERQSGLIVTRGFFASIRGDFPRPAPISRRSFKR